MTASYGLRIVCTGRKTFEPSSCTSQATKINTCFFLVFFRQLIRPASHLMMFTRIDRLSKGFLDPAECQILVDGWSYLFLPPALSAKRSLILVYAGFKVSYQPDGVIKAERSQQ
jgi:hypothetical protein